MKAIRAVNCSDCSLRPRSRPIHLVERMVREDQTPIGDRLLDKVNALRRFTIAAYGELTNTQDGHDPWTGGFERFEELYETPLRTFCGTVESLRPQTPVRYKPEHHA